MTEISQKPENLLVIGVWELDIVWNLGFGDWNLMHMRS